MGKRRTDLPHKDRYADDDDDDEVVEEYEKKEPLSEEQETNIKSRKKLVAKRRAGAGSETALGSIFSAGSTPFSFMSKPSTTTTEEDKSTPSVFTGFKGFSAFKPSTETTTTPALTTTNTTTNSIFSGGSTLKFTGLTSTTEKSQSTTNQVSSLTNGSKPLTESTTGFSFLGSKPINGDHKKEEESKSESSESEEEEKTKQKDFKISELKFMNELSNLYKSCYGDSKRVYKLPSEALKDIGTTETERENKYACLLAELNKHCVKWISKHVEESPLVILTPVFVDYFQYLILLEKEFYPDTFKKIIDESEKIQKATTTAKPVMFTGLVNGKSVNGSATNGYKEEEKKTDKMEETDKAKENEDIYETNKKFPSLVKSQAQPFAPISLSSTNTNTIDNFKFGASNVPNVEKTSSLFFKQTSTETKSETEAKSETKTETEKKAETKSTFPAISTPLTTFKFGSTTPALPSTTTTAISSVLTEKPQETKKDAGETPSITATKTNFFTSLPTTPSVIASSTTNTPFSTTTSFFKFGSASSTTSTLTNITQSIESKQDETVKQNDTTSPAAEEKKISSAPTSFFSSFAKPTATVEEKKEEDESKQTEITPQTTTNQSSIFKSFTSFGSTTTPTFTFGSQTATTPSSTTLKPAEASAQTTTTISTPFSFSSTLGANKSSVFGTPFGSGDSKSIFGSTFGASNTFAAQPINEEAAGEEEPYEPPKPETSDTKEEGAVLEKRIKLYYFNDTEKKFTDRGIGNLFIKPINDGESSQLIVRADTKLANILLNVKLSKMFPVKKDGPKDVSYVCIPNPPIPNISDKTPCKFLFKVKTAEDANELLEKLNEYKK